MIRNLLELLTQLSLEKVFNWYKKKWQQNPRQTIFLTFITFAILTGTYVLNYQRYYLENIWTIGSNTLVNKNEKIFDELKDLNQRLKLHLLSDVGRFEDTGFDTWTFADIIVGLSFEDIQLNLSDINVLENYLKKTMAEEGCWKQYKNKPSEFCHIAATSWVLMAYANINKYPPDLTIDFLLENQHHDGWWALYDAASDDTSNASTYATIMALLSLEANLEKGLIKSNDKKKLVIKSKERAAQWLISKRRNNTCKWKGYPNRLSDKSILTMSGMAVYSLNKIKYKGIKDINKICIEYLTKELIRISEKESSLAHITLKNGIKANDNVRHNPLIWTLMGVQSAYSDASLLAKLRAKYFIRKSLFGHDIAPEIELENPWEKGELAFLTRTIISNSK